MADPRPDPPSGAPAASTDAALSAERLRALFEQATAGIVMADLHGRFLAVNDRFCTLTGRSRSELLRLSVQDITHPDDLPRNLELYQRLAAGGPGFTLEKRYVRPDGSVAWVAVSVGPVHAADGTLLHVVAVIQDITDRREAVEALRASEQLAQRRLDELHATYDTAPVGLAVIDTELRYVRINERLAELNGVPAADHIGRTVGEIVPDLIDQVLPFFRQVLDTGRPLLNQELVGETRAQPGVRRVWIEQWHPLRNADGAIIGINVVVEEVTEQRRAEEALRQAQKLQAVGQLAGGMAHELNNMLAASLGFSSFALRHFDGSHPARREIEQAIRAQERAARITQQVLAFSRRQVLQTEPLDVDAVVGEIAPLLRRSLDPAQELRLVLSAAGTHVLTDRTQLEQALLNLVLNARDALPGGGVITLETAVHDLHAPRGAPLHDLVPDGRYVSITVRDPGTGMDAETQRRALEPFFTTKPVGSGTGLGLSMVYGMVRQSGGTLRIYSTPGCGTDVKLYFPPAAATAAAGAMGPAPASPGAGQAVLVIEDEPFVREILVAALEDGGYRVLSAADGAAGVALLAQHPGEVRLVVCDVVLPGVDGTRTAARLRAVHPAVPLLLISGYPGDEIAERGWLPAGVPFLAKPFTPDTLLAKVRELLAGAAA